MAAVRPRIPQPITAISRGLDCMAWRTASVPAQMHGMRKQRAGWPKQSTPLRALLQLLAVDSLVMAVTTTSGCVRATVIDAFSENYRIALAEEGCFDRSQASHAINLSAMVILWLIFFFNAKDAIIGT